MANYVKSSLGKNSLRLGSMLLAVLMVILTVFVGTAQTTAKAETEAADLGNVIKIGGAAGLDCTQDVALEAGKTYVFSYYFEGPSFVTGLIYNGVDTSAAACSPTKVVYDEVYKKVIYEFVASETAPSAEEAGKVSILLGVQVPTKDAYYFYSPCVYAKDDATQTNLFFDYAFTGRYTLKDADGNAGNWRRGYSSSGLLGSRYSKQTLESLGGMDLFINDTAVKMIAGTNHKFYFGQNVTLEKGKTYTFAFNYSGKEPDYLLRIQDGSYTSINSTVKYDTDLLRKYITFTVPAVYDKVAGSTLTVYVGIIGPNDTVDTYYSHFKLYDVEDPQINLFQDGALLENGTDFITAWKEPTYNLQKTNFSKVSLEDVGGLDIFKKPERKVLKMFAESREYFGQNVTLEKGKTYTFSYYYTGWDAGLLIRIQDGSYTSIPETVAYDDNYSKKYITFTVPAVYDIVEGPTLSVYVGILGAGNVDDTYYYDFRLYETAEPQCNLFADDTFLSNGDTFDGVWKHPSKALQSANFEKVTLAAAGGMDIFERPANAVQITNYKNVTIGQNVVLEAGKTYLYSYYYQGPALVKGLISDGYDETHATAFDITPTKTVYDSEYKKVTLEFVAPADALSAGEAGKVVVYLGIQVLTADTYYFCSPCVCAKDDATQTNLFKDYKLAGVNTLTSSSGTPNWYKSYSFAAVGNKFSCQSLELLGGMDFFKKTDADRFVLMLAPNTSGQPYFGQRVTLEAGKTYIFSNCYLDNYSANQEIYTVASDNSREQIVDVTVTDDEELSRRSVKFTVPADESGIKTVYVGFRGNKADNPLYYYDFRLYEEGNPDENLLADYALIENGDNINTTVWKSPSGLNISENYSKVTLDTIGGINAFLPYAVKCDLTGDKTVDVRDLIRMKKFSLESIDSLPEGTGDLNCNTTAGDADDLILLRKEILK